MNQAEAGKTLEFLTQGKFPAVPHRLAFGRATGRVSLAFKLRAPLAAELVLQHGDVTTVPGKMLGRGIRKEDERCVIARVFGKNWHLMSASC